MPIIIQVFSDYVCPFCRLGEVALSNAATKTNAQIIWRAHQLRASGPPQLEPRGEMLNEGWRRTVYPMAAALGVELRQPSRLPLTRNAHEAAAWARAQGRFEQFHQAIFQAFFVEDQDIGEVAVLQEIARKLALNAADLAQAARERRYAEDVDEDLLIGRTYGVRGVPSFIIGGQLLYGVQEERTLIEAIERTGRGETVNTPAPAAQMPVNITRK